MRTAILHIGTEKTGSTTIQAFLTANRDQLKKIGFAYPASTGTPDSGGLTFYAMHPARCEEIHCWAGLTTAEARRDVAQRLDVELAAELATLPRGIGTVIFSSEHCHSRLRDRDELERLRALLLRHFDRIRILVYLRRQDRVAVSLYSTMMYGGDSHRQILPPVDSTDGFYNYEAGLDRWSEVFSPESIQPRLFEAEDLIGGDLLTDFCAACGIGDTSGLTLPVKRNQSCQPAAQEFLRRMNALVPVFVGGRPNQERGPLSAWIAAAFPGTGRLPSRAEVGAFLDMFAVSNERVRQRWFPERRALFDDDLSHYPERSDDRLTFEDAVRVLAALWQRSMAEVTRLKAELAFKEGRLAELEGRRLEAEGFFRRALGLDPEHPHAERRLVRITRKRRSVVDRLRARLLAASNRMIAVVMGRDWQARAARYGAGRRPRIHLEGRVHGHEGDDGGSARRRAGAGVRAAAGDGDGGDPPDGWSPAAGR
jgi:hypothetical protein